MADETLRVGADPSPAPATSAIEARLDELERNLAALAGSAKHRLEDDARAIDYLARDLASTQQEFRELLQGKPTLPEGVKDPDDPLKCACGFKLALYSPAEDLLRLKIREQYVTMRVGPGCFVDITCPRCGRVSHNEYVEG